LSQLSTTWPKSNVGAASVAPISLLVDTEADDYNIYRTCK